ncbi:MAG: ATP synthase F1 subunit gamma [Candidatus Melainabacteria bacterium]|nr:ATP synthase F1 subunit gamma [Candidatus Melainabacteria bacterium]
MPNLKSIKVRIKSIKSTQKITQAMKLVAASKVRKAQVRVLNSRPYSQRVTNFTKRTVSAMSSLEKQEIPLMNQRDVQSVGIIVISSDRGLCGSYNTNIIKRTAKRILELEKSGIKPKLITVGNKANNFFRRTKTEILESFTQLPATPSVELANLIANSAEISFTNKTIDSVEIIGTDFISMLRNEAYTKHFLPIKEDSSLPSTSQSEFSSNKSSREVLFEPSLSIVLQSLIPLYLSNIIYHALLEANCSELASRMNAMSNATKNAKELIENLTIVYNKARQATITQELAEIVGGVEALK